MRRFFRTGDTAVGDVAVCGMEDGDVVCMVARCQVLGEFINEHEVRLSLRTACLSRKAMMKGELL